VRNPKRRESRCQAQSPYLIRGRCRLGTCRVAALSLRTFDHYKSSTSGPRGLRSRAWREGRDEGCRPASADAQGKGRIRRSRCAGVHAPGKGREAGPQRASGESPSCARTRSSAALLGSTRSRSTGTRRERSWAPSFGAGQHPADMLPQTTSARLPATSPATSWTLRERIQTLRDAFRTSHRRERLLRDYGCSRDS
jgi:hypothetical protein